MGNRRRSVAWGAAFALIVAACAATDAPTSSRPRDRSQAPESAAASDPHPESLANVVTESTDDPTGCAAGAEPTLSLHDAGSGELLWSLEIARPGGQTVLHDDVVFVSFAWDRTQTPGVGAVDLSTRSVRWRKDLDDEPEQLVVVGQSLIVVTRDSIQALDLVTGDDEWSIGSEFVFTEAIVEGGWAYAINNVAVHGINLRTGELMWQLPIERPDELAARGDLLAVAARNRVVAVDTANQTFLWDEQVNRLSSGNMWIGPDAVIVELAPSESPSGGLAAIDRRSGFGRWRLDSVGTVHWPDRDQLVTTVASPRFRGTQRYDLMSIDIATGEPLWAVPTTVESSSGVLSVADGRVLVYEPHPAVAGIRRLRLIDTNDGSVLWELPSTSPIDGARIESDLFVSTYTTNDMLSGDRGEATMILGPGRAWTISTADGIEQDLRLADGGVVAISGERSPFCIGRDLGEPSSTGSVERSVSLRAG